MAPLTAPEPSHGRGEEFAAKLNGRIGQLPVAEGPADGGQRVLHRGRGIEVEGALLVPLGLVGGVVDPYRGNACVLDWQEAVTSHDAPQVVRKSEQPGVRLAQRIEVARVRIVVPAVEVELHAMIENRSPAGEIELPLDEPGQPVVGRPGVEEIAVLRHALAPGRQEPCGQPRLAEHQVDRVQLVPAVAAVLLALARHAVHERLLRNCGAC